MSRGPDAATLLTRRLQIAADAAGQALTIGDTVSVPWASATFSGERHRLTVSGSGPTFEHWLQSLPEADLPLRGHLVADLALLAVAVDHDSVRADIEVLTVEDR
ncbi:hypothetical protein ACBY01_13835 [Sphingomonas sp. ac-8]|uniref:hypothetical protein n=1 Tax=Sphingomonas sp. ac-8 TaxID=3242977 RepID=UPI003A81161B